MSYGMQIIKAGGVSMEEELKGLEEKRRKLYRKLSAIGDFSRGMISVYYLKCGKPNCVCAQEGH